MARAGEAPQRGSSLLRDHWQELAWHLPGTAGDLGLCGVRAGMQDVGSDRQGGGPSEEF